MEVSLTQGASEVRDALVAHQDSLPKELKFDIYRPEMPGFGIIDEATGEIASLRVDETAHCLKPGAKERDIILGSAVFVLLFIRERTGEING